jgi:hypothetical protein
MLVVHLYRYVYKLKDTYRVAVCMYGMNNENEQGEGRFDMMSHGVPQTFPSFVPFLQEFRICAASARAINWKIRLINCDVSWNVLAFSTQKRVKFIVLCHIKTPQNPEMDRCD